MSLQPPNYGTPEAPASEIEDHAHFSCSICSKIFTKRLSRNRHVLYCRQRQLKQSNSRKKSCMLCRRAKNRCSETLPQCTRCKRKGLQCKYDGEQRIDSGVQLPVLDECESRNDIGVDSAALAEPARLPAQAWNMSLLNPGHVDLSQVDLRLNSLTPSQDSLIGSLLDGTINFDWNLGVPQYEGTDDGFDPNRLDRIAQDMCNSERQLAVSSYPDGSNQITGHLGNDSSFQSSRQDLFQHTAYSHMAAPEISLLSARAARIEPISSGAQKIGLFRRRERSFGSQLSAYYLLQTLRSYPKMMLSGTLPPFIHENCGGSGSRILVTRPMESPNPLLPEPLAICKSIMYMYFSKTSESNSFVWRTIETELNRLDTEFRAFDECTLMSALQALTVYILVATLEEDNLSPSIDAKMLHVMMAVASKIEEPNYTFGIAQYGEWQEWILQESRDRTFTLLFIINMLFDINPTHDPNICNAILAMPVPAHKSLWQATSYPEWKKVHTDFVQKREGRPSLTYRDMVELHQKSQTTQKHTIGDLDDWFLNLDSFGTFVLMTATSI